MEMVPNPTKHSSRRMYECLVIVAQSLAYSWCAVNIDTQSKRVLLTILYNWYTSISSCEHNESSILNSTNCKEWSVSILYVINK